MTKIFDRKIIDSVAISSYCLGDQHDKVLNSLPETGQVFHVIRAESLAKYVPYDIEVTSNFSKLTTLRARGTVVFQHASSQPPNHKWTTDTLMNVYAPRKDIATLVCNQASVGTSIEIESHPGQIACKPSGEATWTTNQRTLAIKLRVR